MCNVGKRKRPVRSKVLSCLNPVEGAIGPSWRTFLYFGSKTQKRGNEIFLSRVSVRFWFRVTTLKRLFWVTIGVQLSLEDSNYYRDHFIRTNSIISLTSVFFSTLLHVAASEFLPLPCSSWLVFPASTGLIFEILHGPVKPFAYLIQRNITPGQTRLNFYL